MKAAASISAGGRPARPAHHRCRHPQNHRQRHQFRPPVLRLRNRPWTPPPTALRCAHTEAARRLATASASSSCMGRESGFIAANASLSMREVNFVPRPRGPFQPLLASGACSRLWKNALPRTPTPCSPWRRGRGRICFPSTKPAATPRATRRSATSPGSCARRSPNTFQPKRYLTISNTSIRATSSVPSPPTPTTGCTAAFWANMPCTRP